MSTATREQFLDEAEKQFSEHGFHGTSIASIAKELDLTKQALLHYFGTKEKLYATVLLRIAERFEAMEDEPVNPDLDPRGRLKRDLMGLATHPSQTRIHYRLIVRELLDNMTRAKTAGTWALQPFLERYIKLIQSIPNWEDASDMEALALVYQFLGAINYFGISEATLTGIFGEEQFKELRGRFATQLDLLIDAGLNTRG